MGGNLSHEEALHYIAGELAIPASVANDGLAAYAAKHGILYDLSGPKPTPYDIGNWGKKVAEGLVCIWMKR